MAEITRKRIGKLLRVVLQILSGEADHAAKCFVDKQEYKL
jgi:hypothetical protein